MIVGFRSQGRQLCGPDCALFDQIGNDGDSAVLQPPDRSLDSLTIVVQSAYIRFGNLWDNPARRHPDGIKQAMVLTAQRMFSGRTFEQITIRARTACRRITFTM
jgi:hypothetical protein